MSIRLWVHPQRRLLGLFVAAMVTIAAALGWLGWRLLEQDRDPSRQRIQERLESASELATSMLVRKLSEAENQLITPLAAESKSADTLTVVFTPESIEAHPAARLAYYPFVPAVCSRDNLVCRRRSG